MKLVKATKELLLSLGVGDYIIYDYGKSDLIIVGSNVYKILKIRKGADGLAIIVCDLEMQLNNVVYKEIPITIIPHNMYLSFGLKKRINKILSL